MYSLMLALALLVVVINSGLRVLRARFGPVTI